MASRYVDYEGDTYRKEIVPRQLAMAIIREVRLAHGIPISTDISRELIDNVTMRLEAFHADRNLERV